MSHIFIIGVTGGVGHHLAPLLMQDGHHVSGLHRKTEQAEELKAKGITPVYGDLMTMSTADMIQATRGADVVVFSAGAAGSGLERTSTIDGEGPLKLIEAAHANGIQRLYLVSVIPDAGRDREPQEGFEHYMRVKKQADIALVNSGLDWVILRPGTLQDEASDPSAAQHSDARVCLAQAVKYGEVKRKNVARVLAALIQTPAIHHEILELTDGDTPVPEAVNALRRKTAEQG